MRALSLIARHPAGPATGTQSATAGRARHAGEEDTMQETQAGRERRRVRPVGPIGDRRTSSESP